jgi:adenosylmethionine---8-amino-7-oxononanoate aminotransferase
VRPEHLWFPYAQMQTMPVPFKVVGAKGSSLFLEDGRTLIDGVASWWSVAHGYQHPHMVEAITKQAQTLSHVMLGGLVHAQAETLAARLVEMTPDGLTHVFFSDSGSTAVEVALKMALQYWRNIGKTGKERFLCFTHGYHGDTLGAMSVSDPATMHRAFKHAVIPQFVVDIPSDEYGFAEFDSLLESASKEIAGVILEPLVQGAGGLKFHEPDVLAEIYRITKKHNVLFIADEIAVGFARTGKMFACEEAGISPDILCLGKALTGGAIGLGATLATSDIFESFLDDSPAKAFMHGPTFMGNPLACAAANASLDLFANEPRLKQVEAIEAQLLSELAACEGLPCVRDVRVKGAVGVVELTAETPFNPTDFRLQAAQHGCFIRPIKNVIYLWPALTISADELSQLTGTIRRLIPT